MQPTIRRGAVEEKRPAESVLPADQRLGCRPSGISEAAGDPAVDLLRLRRHLQAVEQALMHLWAVAVRFCRLIGVATIKVGSMPLGHQNSTTLMNSAPGCDRLVDANCYVPIAMGSRRSPNP